MHRNDQDDELEQQREHAQEDREERLSPTQRRKLSPVAQLQRTVGNSRLLQLRAMQLRAAAASAAPIQRRDIFEEARADVAARHAERQESQLEEQAAQVSIPSGGQSLPPAVQARAEQHLGVGMSDVRVVHGADQATDPIQAQAFTTMDGSTPKVVLGSGVDLSSNDGQFTLMHELTHVAQQKKGMSDGLSGLGGDGGLRDDLESHADHNAAHMCSPGHKH